MEEENKIDVLSQAFEHLLYLSDLPNPEIINPKKINQNLFNIWKKKLNFLLHHDKIKSSNE